jgi:hypothetical protein
VHTYGIMGEIGACLLGAGTDPGYEQSWSAVQEAPSQPQPMTGLLPFPAELDWARLAAAIPHHVLSSTLTSTRCPNTQLVRTLEEVEALKQQPGRGIHLIGGAQATAGLIEAGLVDELRLIVHR